MIRAEVLEAARGDRVSRSLGCPRCRMDLLQFVREVRLPRFTMQAGEQWSLLQCRYTPDGSASLGAGLRPRDSFVVLAVDADRACA